MRIFPLIQKATVVVFFVILLIYALVQAKTLLYPLTMAMLITFLLLPVANYLESKNFPRILANFIVIFGAVALIAGVGYLLYWQVNLFLEEAPELKDQARANVDLIAESISSKVGVTTRDFKLWVNQYINDLGNSELLTGTVFPSTTTTIMAIGLMPVYVFLMLFYRNKVYSFLMMIFPSRHHDRAVHAINEISHVTIHYMRGVFTVVLILCFLNSIGLLIVGVRFAILLGIISALCNFIPYFGTLLGALFPLLMAIFTGDSPNQAIGVIILFIIIQFTENNILTPNITGGSVQINPFVTIVSIIAGGMIWGVPGMFVVVPVIGMFKIILDNYEPTKPFAFLLGTDGTEKHSITMRKLRHIFTFKKDQDREI